jgi:hypothetical protein
MSADAATILLDQQNHYNQKLGKCFALLEWHYDAGRKNGSWFNHMWLYDVFENSEYGEMTQETSIGADFKSTENILSCKVMGTVCKTVPEFNHLTEQYLSQ